jgi:hypothetical protein
MPETACDILRYSPRALPEATSRGLIDLASGSPALARARSAYAQRLTAIVLTGIGAAALAAGFLQWFFVDPNSHPELRIESYALVGGTVGLGVIATVLGATSVRADRLARVELQSWGNRCRPRPEPPAELVPASPE